MKHRLIVKLAGIVLGVSGISTAYGSLLDSAKQNASTGTSDEPITTSSRASDRYSPYARDLIIQNRDIVTAVLEERKAEGRAEGRVEGRAEGMAEGIASIIRSGLLSYDAFMSSDQYSDDIKAKVSRLLADTPQ